MVALLEPDQARADQLLAALPGDTHRAVSADGLLERLDRRDEYAVVLGSGLALDQSLALAEKLRTTHPAASVVLVREQVDAQVLTSAMHAGVRDVVTVGDDAALDTAVARARELWSALRGTTSGREPSRVITVFSPKGGVGKTTMSVNLACALAETGRLSVCLVDLDLAFGDVAITLQLFPTHSIEHAVGAEEALDEALLDTLLTTHDSGVRVLAAPSAPDARDRVTPLLVQRMLRGLRELFDVVVVDSAPNFDDQTLTALDETDECVLVATLDVPTLKNVKVALETLDALAIAEGHRHLLLNRADDAVGISSDKVESILGMPVDTQVATAIDIAASTNAGQPLILTAPDHPSSRALRALAARLVGLEALVPAGADPLATDDASRRRFRFRRTPE